VKDPAEQIVKEIRRASRRQFSAEEKIRIVLPGLRGEDVIAELCRREGIVKNLYYRWSKEFLEAGKKRVAGDTVAPMTDFPRSLIDFQQRFGDETACAQYLIATRWPNGFVCPGCGGGKAWRLETKAWTYECASCGRQTSVTAGTIMHHSKLPLTAWFWAAYLMATHSNGISALRLQRQLGFGSYKTAWLICAKLRSSMLAPRRSPLAGLVEGR